MSHLFPADDAASEARRAKQLEAKRRWAAKNRAKVCAYAASYREQYPDRRKKAKDAWNAKNKDKVNGYNRAWQKRNPGKARAARRLWELRYPELAREDRRLRAMFRCARRKNAQGDATMRALKALIFESIGKHCGYCGIVLSRTNISLDHITPFSKGGKNDMANINPVCSPCNLLKRSKLWPVQPPV